MTPEVCGTVLIIEDDDGVRELQRRRLERAGFHVVTAASAEEALQALTRPGVALIVMDYRLPGEGTGLDLYAQLKRAGHELPVIMVTGFSEQAVVIRALRAGVRDFLTKSAEYLDYLPEAVTRVLKQVRTEHRLAQSEARLAGIVNSAMDAIITVGADGHITLFNAAAERIFGRSVADAVGQPLHLLVPAMVNGTGSLLEQPANTGHLCARWFELRGLRADGSEFPLEASVSAAEVEGRRFYIVIVRDITERKQAEERLREQAALLDRATNAIVVQDLDHGIRFWNQGATRLYGWTAEEVVGKNTKELLFQGAATALDEASRTVVEAGEWNGEQRQKTKDGKDVCVESRWTLVRDPDGRPKSILVINTDLTDKKTLEAQVLRTQRMESLGTLAGGIAHDLNNVLTPILMAVELLKGKVKDPTSQSCLGMLQSSAERGADMVKQVLSFARGADGQRMELQLRHVLRDIEKMLQHTLPKSIEIRLSVPKDLWPVRGDATQLYQVLMNLCLNARDAMPVGGRLTVSAQNAVLDEHYSRMNIEAKPGSYVVLSVADTGTGIPEGIVEKIFDPFFTTKPQGKGTGLGLCTALGIVKNHGGFITTASKVGQGTEFSVYLPAVATTKAGDAPDPNRNMPLGHGEHILVVDDDVSIRGITQATLEAHGYHVLAAGDGTEALALYAQHQQEIKAVLTDMMMPIMDGPATIRALRKLSANVPIIAVSGLAQDGKTSGLAGVEAKARLLKPYTAEKLLTTLREVLDQVDGRDAPIGETNAHGQDPASVSDLASFAGAL